MGLLEQQVHALHQQLSDTPEDIEMPDEPAPRWPMYVFLAGACVCLSFSSVCHTLACVGARRGYTRVHSSHFISSCLVTFAARIVAHGLDIVSLGIWSPVFTTRGDGDGE